MGSKLKYVARLSRTEAGFKVCAHAMFGAHSTEPRPKTPPEVAQFFQHRGASPDAIAEECRDFRRRVPCFETALGATWNVTAEGGGKVQVINDLTAEIESSVTTDGILSMSVYQSTLEAACRARDRAVETFSFEEYHATVQAGIASVEAFIQAAVDRWNHFHADDKLIDSKQNKVSLQTKLDEWIPRMTGGNRLHKGDQRWAHFKQLVVFRDAAVHPKSGSYGMTLADLAELINMFRPGSPGCTNSFTSSFRPRFQRLSSTRSTWPDVIVVPEGYKTTTPKGANAATTRAKREPGRKKRDEQKRKKTDSAKKK